jgi:hypothetical protein
MRQPRLPARHSIWFPSLWTATHTFTGRLGGRKKSQQLVISSTAENSECGNHLVCYARFRRCTPRCIVYRWLIVCCPATTRYRCCRGQTNEGGTNVNSLRRLREHLLLEVMNSKGSKAVATASAEAAPTDPRLATPFFRYTRHHRRRCRKRRSRWRAVRTPYYP